MDNFWSVQVYHTLEYDYEESKQQRKKKKVKTSKQVEVNCYKAINNCHSKEVKDVEIKEESYESDGSYVD